MNEALKIVFTVIVSWAVPKLLTNMDIAWLTTGLGPKVLPGVLLRCVYKRTICWVLAIFLAGSSR